MRPPRGTTLLLLLLLVYLAVLNGREIFREKNLPAVPVGKERKIRVLLGEGFPLQAIHQFSDGIDLETVISLTIAPMGSGRLSSVVLNEPVMDGENLSVVRDGVEIIEVIRRWMPAGQRIAIGVKLHPDRMTLEDWEALPGIGARLAERIEENRQKSGDFGSIENLQRVTGIGSKSIERWRCFF
ncbi:ComEA family DNA-binding protein [Trichloromonas sp.]|uniref:ComEA family DNA-binding protein n=1 Tax=Trichloromonas sp. TaxID=3069249 RepID=UPI003D81A8F3